MLLVVHILLALFSVFILFLSNFDQRVSYSLLSLYLFIFLFKWARNKISFLFKITILLAGVAFGYAYLKIENAPEHLENAVSGITKQRWNIAQDNFVKIVSECDPCRKDILNFADGFNQEKIQMSFSEKSEKIKMMMAIIKDKHQNIDTKDLPKVLLEKSKMELLDLKIRFERAQNNSRVLRKLANQKEDFALENSDFDNLESAPSQKYDHEFYLTD